MPPSPASWNSGWFVLGKEVEAFEAEYAAFCGTRHCVGLGNGLEALELVLRGWDLGAGDEVIVPSNTYIATWLAVTAVGAKVVPVEPTPDGPNIDPERIAAAITLAHQGDHAGPSLRRAGRHGRHHGAGAQARAQGDRGRGAGAGRQGARPAHRRAGRCRRPQLLPDQEFRRLRRWRRGHDRRRQAGRAAARAAQLRQQGEVREPRARLQLAARRDAGGPAAREAAQARCLERAPPAACRALRRQAGRHSRPRPAARAAMGRAGLASLRRAHASAAPS